MNFETLAGELSGIFELGARARLSESEFDALARRVFAWQMAENGAYRRFCEARGRTPKTIGSWREIPAVPATAFKHLDLVSGDPGSVERVFRTSGTTRGGALRGRHLVPSLALYRAASVEWMRAHLLPEGGSIPILSLVPTTSETPESSLSTMVDFALEEFGAEGSDTFATAADGVDVDRLTVEVDQRVLEGRPILLIGTAFSLVHWIDGAADRGWRTALPEGSRLMETGGFKGRSREIARPRLYELLGELLGLAPDRIINEYGMTELLSQFWEPTLRSPAAGRRHHAPAWLRTRVLDPVDLSERPTGEPGILQHFDLANLGSVSAVLTEDRGILHPDGGLELLGRAPGAEPRGCSMTMEAVLEANR